ncbi:centrosomal protein POC5 isoform X2 [Festucalex cinctus]
MSSDEEAGVPVSPTEATNKSDSVSPELQVEYEELLQSAGASPRVEGASVAHPVGSGATNLATEGHSQVGDTGHSTSRGLGRANGLQDASESAQPNTQEITEYAEVEFFISDEKINKMENILYTWTQNLKINVLRELKKWRVAFVEKHKQEVQKARELSARENEALKAEVGSLTEQLHTFENSNKRKDEMIRNLSVVLNRQKQKLEKMKAFTQWRVQYFESKEEAYASQVARQHYNLNLKRKVWLAWHSLTQKEWKVRMEQACRARAEEVCTRLSHSYEAQIQMMHSEHNEALARAHAEIERLQLERERREVCMKKALMRGVCALNMETLTLFTTTDGGPQVPDMFDPNSPPDDDPDTAGRGPPPFEYPRSPRDDSDRMGFGAPRPHPEFPTTSTAHPSAHPQTRHPAARHAAAGHPASGHSQAAHTAASLSLYSHGAGAVFHKQGSGGGLIAGQQKSKSLAARSSTQHFGKSTRGNQDTSVAPPMSSTAVDFHHPLTQQTVGQATASKYLRSSQQAPGAAGGWASSRMRTSAYSPPPWDEPGCAPLAQCGVGSPVHFDCPESPSHHEDSRMGVWYTSEVLPSTSAAHSSFPQAGSSTFHKQTSGRIVTAGQQKPAKTITARTTSQPISGKSVRSNLQVMGMAPPISSIVVERHQPITQHTIRPSQQGPRTPTVVKNPSKTNVDASNAHSIKVVD